MTMNDNQVIWHKIMLITVVITKITALISVFVEKNIIVAAVSLFTAL